MFFFILMLSIIVGTQNDQVVVFNYLLAQVEIRLSALLACALLSGVAIASLGYCFIWLNMRWKLARLTRVKRATDK
jgi:uncharacterized membrane protein YciS (DUF1049 family)